jgi:hypothetical protein
MGVFTLKLREKKAAEFAAKIWKLARNLCPFEPLDKKKSHRRLAAFGPSGGGAPDAAEGRALPETVGTREHRVSLLMDKAYEGGRTRVTAGGVGV